MISALLGHHRPVAVVEEEELLQIRLRHRVAIATERHRFLIDEEFHRHARTVGPKHHNPTSK